MKKPSKLTEMWVAIPDERPNQTSTTKVPKKKWKVPMSVWIYQGGSPPAPTSAIGFVRNPLHVWELTDSKLID